MANEELARWMTAPMLPLKIQAAQRKDVIEVIDGRVFTVELYAGLCEEVVEVAAGEPAGATEPVHVFQRQHYMDEECLVQYEAGGMKFSDIKEFDAWIARPQNRDRILPFPRTIVAFRVRRHERAFRATRSRNSYNLFLSATRQIHFPVSAKWRSTLPHVG